MISKCGHRIVCGEAAHACLRNIFLLPRQRFLDGRRTKKSNPPFNRDENYSHPRTPHLNVASYAPRRMGLNYLIFWMGRAEEEDNIEMEGDGGMGYISGFEYLVHLR